MIYVLFIIFSLDLQFLLITSSNMMMSSETVIHCCSGILQFENVWHDRCVSFVTTKLNV